MIRVDIVPSQRGSGIRQVKMLICFQLVTVRHASRAMHRVQATGVTRNAPESNLYPTSDNVRYVKLIAKIRAFQGAAILPCGVCELLQRLTQSSLQIAWKTVE